MAARRITRRNAYFPIPYSRGVVEDSPNAGYPQLLPKFSLADGTELMPLAFMHGIALTKDGVSYSQDGPRPRGRRTRR
jgi:hypothetical protein